MTPAVTIHCFADELNPASALAALLGLQAETIGLHRFPDGESLPSVSSPGRTAIVYRSLNRPDEKLVPLTLAADALRRSGAERLVLVAPYLAYMRQDAVFEPGQPISQRVVAALLGMSFDRVITVDAHLHRTAHLADLFGGTEADDLSSAPALVSLINQSADRPTLIVGPDEESAPWVRAVAEAIGASWLTLKKTRHGDTAVDVILGDPAAVAGQDVLVVDDICSTGGTLQKALAAVSQAGAASVSAYVTHALFGDEVAAKLMRAGAGLIVSSDSVPHPSNAVLLASVLAEALGREFTGRQPTLASGSGEE